MKKWFNFFFLSFFFDRTSKEGAKRGYTNVFLGLLLAFIFLWSGFVGGVMLPFAVHYANAPDFAATVQSLLANPDLNKRIDLKITDGVLAPMNVGEDYTAKALVNTFENESDKQNYSVNGYDVVVDFRPADTLAEVEVYYVSNDGQNLIISYEEYLTLSDVAKLNFDFKLKYTGKALELTEEKVKEYRTYLEDLGEESKQKTEKLAKELADGKTTQSEYDRAVYELYFTSRYPNITDYESTSKVPLLRNYYYHQYIKEGKCKYLFIFDDYIAGSFETDGGIDLSFYGFYNGMDNRPLIDEGMTRSEANRAADDFVKNAFNEMFLLNAYAYAMNVISLIPFIALMPLVVTLLVYSILKLNSVESIKTFGSAFKVIGSYVWFSGAIAALITVVLSFFVQPSLITALPLVLFFITLTARSIIFAVNEARLYRKQLEQQETVQTEV